MYGHIFQVIRTQGSAYSVTFKTNTMSQKKPKPFLLQGLGFFILSGILLLRNVIHHKGIFQNTQASQQFTKFFMLRMR